MLILFFCGGHPLDSLICVGCNVVPAAVAGGGEVGQGAREHFRKDARLVNGMFSKACLHWRQSTWPMLPLGSSTGE
jgi:hypothetical protein